MLNEKRLAAFRLINFTPRGDGVYKRLPEVYKKFYENLFFKTPKPVHYIERPGRYEFDAHKGIIIPVQNIPLPTKFPKELNNVLLGGEMVIRGFEKKGKYHRRVPKFWLPNIKRTVVYSEILNKYFNTLAAKRLILQIHEYKGFDNYLLQNEPCDLRSFLALKMKRRILQALLDKDLPYDEEKNNEIYEKYKQYIIPREELEWFGLSIHEAIEKQLAIEEAERTNYVPLKHQYRLLFLEELKSGMHDVPEGEGKGGWMKKLNPFAKTGDA